MLAQADGLNIGSWFATIGGIVASGAGLLIVIRNSRSRGRRAALREANSLEEEVILLREEILEERELIYGLQRQISDQHGQIDVKEQEITDRDAP